MQTLQNRGKETTIVTTPISLERPKRRRWMDQLPSRRTRLRPTFQKSASQQLVFSLLPSRDFYPHRRGSMVQNIVVGPPLKFHPSTKPCTSPDEDEEDDAALAADLRKAEEEKAEVQREMERVQQKMQQAMRIREEKREQAKKKIQQETENKRRKAMEASRLAQEELRRVCQEKTTKIKQMTADQVAWQQRDGRLSKEEQDRMLPFIDQLNLEQETLNDVIMGKGFPGPRSETAKPRVLGYPALPRTGRVPTPLRPAVPIFFRVFEKILVFPFCPRRNLNYCY